MKIIFSKKKKKKKEKKEKNKIFLKRYWSVLEPKDYADLMVAQAINLQIKKASNDLKEVELVGTLKQTNDGFVYVKIDDDFIDGIFPLITDDNIKKPPYFDKDGIGAHISAITSDEIEDKEIKEIKEIGKEIPFTFKEVYSTNPQGWDEMSRVWFVSVDIPELVKIRKVYDLPETYEDKGHDFHITVAVRESK